MDIENKQLNCISCIAEIPKDKIKFNGRFGAGCTHICSCGKINFIQEVLDDPIDEWSSVSVEVRDDCPRCYTRNSLSEDGNRIWCLHCGWDISE